jgi:hypothetical protein
MPSWGWGMLQWYSTCLACGNPLIKSQWGKKNVPLYTLLYFILFSLWNYVKSSLVTAQEFLNNVVCSKFEILGKNQLLKVINLHWNTNTLKRKTFSEIYGFTLPSSSMIKFLPHQILLKKTLWCRISVVHDCLKFLLLSYHMRGQN